MTIKTMRNCLLFIILFALFSCNTAQNEKKWIDKGVRAIEYTNILIDTVKLDEIKSSCVGEVGIYSDSIYFVDKKFCWIFSFDKDGKLANKYLGQGAGPCEINTGLIDGYTHTEDGNSIFIGAMNDCHIFSETLEREKTFVIDKGDRRKQDINLNDFAIYTLMYPKLILRENNGYLYFNQYCEHPNFNFIASDNFYKDSKLISRMSLENGKVDKMFGEYSAIYSHKVLNQFNLFSFDIDRNGNFYICFEADSLIYKYDSKYNPVCAYGFPGLGMNIDYKSIDSYIDLKNDYADERRQKSYYDWIEYIDELDLLFRSYKKSNNEFDGLQIYRDSKLISDVDVPKGFRVMGYIKPYVYSNISIDDENETMEIYRFLLKNV